MSSPSQIGHTGCTKPLRTTSYYHFTHSRLSSTCRCTPSSAVCLRITILPPINSRVFLGGLPWHTSSIVTSVISVSHEINKAMDIDSVISRVCKTSSGIVRITFTSEEEGNSAQLE
ncbi:hypothetical protein J1N35_044507 [Gossypium stocksii]|uniref:Uncharacterized protein n=1 Tax=Gossypium stocksii TaxID=47602 RepID=A0A9D3ZGG5_9ROSI|nr:hypothetical protein J1N35_044507 [Gossypium stocksii]